MRLLSGVLCLLFAAPAFAQTELPPTDLRIRLYAPSATSPAWESPTIPIGPPVATCGLDPQPGATGIVVNPTRLQFDDPMLPGKVCVLNMAGGTPPPVPDGVYELAVIGVRASVVGTRESAHVLIAKGSITIRVLSGLIVLP